MRHLALLAFISFAGVAVAQDAPSTIAGARPPCVQVTFTALARGYGYNHVVTVRNTCPQAAVCSVHTDVNPSPQSVTVPAGAAQDVTTFIGSPARVFVPTVACTLRH